MLPRGFKAPRALVPAPATGRGAPALPAGAPGGTEGSGSDRYYKVLVAKVQRGNRTKLRRNRAWSDGVLHVRAPGHGTLYDAKAKKVLSARHPALRLPLANDDALTLGNYDLEIDRAIPKAAFDGGACFLDDPLADGRENAAPAAASRFGRLPVKNAPGKFKRSREAAAAGPLSGPPAGPPRAFEVDNFLASRMRPHQLEGAKFLYERVMGLASPGRHGAILADEMGLGKTLQVLAFVWMAIGSPNRPLGGPAVRRAIVAVPASLVDNWQREIRKWLGDYRLKHVALHPAAPARKWRELCAEFCAAPKCVLVGSYELVRKHAAALTRQAQLLVCDEGHRLKEAKGNQTIAALLALGCPHRVILTGTPMQNNLTEFYALVNFVVPGLLGELSTFRNFFEAAVARGNDRAATEADRELAQQRARELQARCDAVVLRRTSEVNRRFLPPKTEMVVFCRPAAAQVAAYRAALGAPDFQQLFASAHNLAERTLPMIMKVREIGDETAVGDDTCGHALTLGTRAPPPLPPRPGAGDLQPPLPRGRRGRRGRHPGRRRQQQAGVLPGGGAGGRGQGRRGRRREQLQAGAGRRRCGRAGGAGARVPHPAH